MTVIQHNIVSLLSLPVAIIDSMISITLGVTSDVNILCQIIFFTDLKLVHTFIAQISASSAQS